MDVLLTTPLRRVLETLCADAAAAPAHDDATALLFELIRPLPVAALVANNAGAFVAANRAATSLTGYSAAELKRLSMWQITPGMAAREAEILWRAFLDTREQTGEYRLLTKRKQIVTADYAARAHVLPGLHVSLLRACSVVQAKTVTA